MGKTLVLCFTCVINVYDINGIIWYTQVELVLVISVLTRKFRYLNNKIDLTIFQEGKEGELKSENILTKNSPLLREALGPLSWAFSDENPQFNCKVASISLIVKKLLYGLMG